METHTELRCDFEIRLGFNVNCGGWLDQGWSVGLSDGSESTFFQQPIFVDAMSDWLFLKKTIEVSYRRGGLNAIEQMKNK